MNIIVFGEFCHPFSDLSHLREVLETPKIAVDINSDSDLGWTLPSNFVTGP